MPKFLISAKYTAEGLKGLLDEGGSSREKAIADLIAGHGGTQEAFYYTFGETDVIVIADLPDAVTAAGLAIAISASGRVALTTTPLLTSADLDEAARMEVNYRGPGQST